MVEVEGGEGGGEEKEEEEEGEHGLTEEDWTGTV